MQLCYLTGEVIHVLDHVEVEGSMRGVVVAVIDSDEYSEGFSREHWGHYRKGVLVDTLEIGVVFYQDPAHILEFKKLTG